MTDEMIESLDTAHGIRKETDTVRAELEDLFALRCRHITGFHSDVADILHMTLGRFASLDLLLIDQFLQIHLEELTDRATRGSPASDIDFVHDNVSFCCVV